LPSTIPARAGLNRFVWDLRGSAPKGFKNLILWGGLPPGAPLPPGADTVVPLEKAQERDGAVLLEGPVEPGAHVRCKGEDLRAGELVLGAGTVLGPAEISALASCSRLSVAVVRRARVAILSHVEPGLDGTTVVARPAGGAVPADRRDVLASDTGLMRVAMREGRTLVSPDVFADPRVEHPPALPGRVAGETLAVLAVPLAVRGAVLGALAIGDTAGRTFDAREIRLAEAFADYAAVVLAGLRPAPRA